MAIENITKTVGFIAEAAMTSTDYRFVKLGTSAQQVVVCGAGEMPIGIRRNSPAINLPVEVVTVQGDIAKLTLGAGGATKGAYLKSDVAGAGVVASADHEAVGAQALEAGSEGEVISVLLTRFTISA